MADNNLFTIKKNTLIRPFIYKTESIGVETLKMILLLAVQIFMLFFTKSFSALLVILFSVLGAVLAEIIVRKVFKQVEYNSLIISVLQGILTGMLIPETFPVVTVFFAVFFTMFIIKYLFGGFSQAWINPVVFVIAVLWFVGGNLFPDFLVTTDFLCSRNPSQLLIDSGVFPISGFDSSVTETLNNTVFDLFKVSIPEGYVSLFWDTHSVIPAFRFNFITLLSSIILFGTDLIKLIIPSTFLVVYLVLVRFLSPLFCNGIPYQGDMLLALLTSGTLFYATFVLQSHGTLPISVVGKVLYGVFAGIFAFVITGCGTSSTGMAFTVLFANIFSLLIQKWEDKTNKRKLQKLIASIENENGVC